MKRIVFLLLLTLDCSDGDDSVKDSAADGSSYEDGGILDSGGSEQEASRYPAAAAHNIDPRGLENAYQALDSISDTQCLLVERDGVIVMEEYFNGSNATTNHDVRSVTKSVTSILIGIAIDNGFIDGVQQTIGDYLNRVLPDLEPAKADITIEQLLTMTSGLPWRELNSEDQDFFAWAGSPDPLLWILDRQMEFEPSTHWNYNTGASHILSVLLTEATGVSALEFARRNMYGPMDEEVAGWLDDPRGYNYGGHGISLTGRAMIKTGRLMLDRGVYQGRRIVSAAWVDESTALRWDTGNAVPWGTGYGYLWWTGTDSDTGLSFYLALGYGGQFIINVPSKNTVVVAATTWLVSDAGDNWYYVLSTIIDNILPSLQ